MQLSLARGIGGKHLCSTYLEPEVDLTFTFKLLNLSKNIASESPVF